MSKYTQEDAAKKLDSELNEAKKINFPAEKILEHIKDFSSNDPTFIDTIMQPHKTLKKCIDYLFEQVKQKYKGSCAVEDAEVYEICRSYYELDDAELERKKAEAEAKRKADAAEREKKAASQKRSETPAKAVEKKPEQKKDSEPLTLFNF